MNILINSNLPEVIDLFSGCGGLALGFKNAGFHITHGIELMPEAVETASYNLHWRYGEESGHISGDITKMDYTDIKKQISPKGCIVIGGPPCQAYSLAGRAKLRSLGDDRVNVKDKRGFLYQDFLRFVIGLEAKAAVMENVPEAVDYGGKNIPEIVCKELEKNGYQAYWTLLNAADFGVPQLRERIFVLAIKNEYGEKIPLPQPDHSSCDDRTTSNQTRFSNLDKLRYYQEPVKGDASLPNWVTVGEALSDLPELFPTANSKYVLNRITAPMPYKTEAQNDYQHMMREWYGSDPDTVTGNCFRKTVRDYPIFAEMKQGDGYVEASAIADHLFEIACKTRKITAFSNPEQYEKLKKQIVPPYDRDKFISKWQRLRENAPSHTLVAHLSVDTYSHIHPIEPRGISVREAARLQSFPDGFLFQCNMGDAFKQIGNAVPPLLARGIALQVKNALLRRL